MACPPEPLNLLELPTEILGQILAPLLTAPGDGAVRLCPCSPAPFAPGTVLPILLAHPRLHAVACPLLYGPCNRFLLDLAGEHGVHVRRRARHQVSGAGPDDELDAHRRGGGGGGGGGHDESFFALPSHRRRLPLLANVSALRRLQSLDVRVDRLRGWVQDDIVPVVSDMILRGRLQQLRLSLVPVHSLSRKTAVSDRVEYAPLAAAQRPPLAGLLGLLADPDLGRAVFWVEGGRHAGWERFRMERGSEGCLGCDGRCCDGREEQAVEIDWRRLLETAGRDAGFERES